LPFSKPSSPQFGIKPPSKELCDSWHDNIGHFDPILSDRILGMFQKAGFSPNIVQKAIQQQTTLSLVVVGIGVALMQESLSYIGHSGVVFTPIKAQTPDLELAIAWHPDTHHPVLESFLNTVRMVEKNRAIE
jgi:DNA-binding transcriptional LysR family regulator